MFAECRVTRRFTPVPTLPQLPPYAVAPTFFPFRSVASRAARLAIGGEREVALAALMAARIARASVGATALPLPLRQARAAAARMWFATLTLPARARLAAQRVVDASATADRQSLAAGLEELTEVASGVLDRASHLELRALVRAITDDGDAA